MDKHRPKPRLPLALAGLAWALGHISPSFAVSVDQKLSTLEQAMELCLAKASRGGFPYYHYPEAAPACNQTKSMLHTFGQEANRNRNLGFSSRVAGLDFDLWMIQFLGGQRMRSQTTEDIKQLARNCRHMDSR
ncbi:MAG: hypothetical protein RLZZ611_2275 [Cyanobacteriota bacterium]